MSLTAHRGIAATLFIQTQHYSFSDEVVLYPAADSFTIIPETKKRIRACNDSSIAGRSVLPQVHFSLGSALIPPRQEQILLKGLQQCRINRSTPLHVTGYTCPLGTEKGNRLLSLKRAKAVARLLRQQGYTVNPRDVEGRGDENPRTENPTNFALNRRVVISQHLIEN